MQTSSYKARRQIMCGDKDHNLDTCCNVKTSNIRGISLFLRAVALFIAYVSTSAYYSSDSSLFFCQLSKSYFEDFLNFCQFFSCIKAPSKISCRFIYLSERVQNYSIAAIPASSSHSIPPHSIYVL